MSQDPPIINSLKFPKSHSRHLTIYSTGATSEAESQHQEEKDTSPPPGGKQQLSHSTHQDKKEDNDDDDGLELSMTPGTNNNGRNSPLQHSKDMTPQRRPKRYSNRFRVFKESKTDESPSFQEEEEAEEEFDLMVRNEPVAEIQKNRRKTHKRRTNPAGIVSPQHRRAQELYQDAMKIANGSLHHQKQESTPGNEASKTDNLNSQEQHQEGISTAGESATASSSDLHISKLTKQYLLLKRCLFLNPSHHMARKHLISLLTRDFLDSKEALIMMRMLGNDWEDSEVGILNLPSEQSTTLERKSMKLSPPSKSERNRNLTSKTASRFQQQHVSPLQPGNIHLPLDADSPSSPFSYRDSSDRMGEQFDSEEHTLMSIDENYGKEGIEFLKEVRNRDASQRGGQFTNPKTHNEENANHDSPLKEHSVNEPSAFGSPSHQQASSHTYLMKSLLAEIEFIQLLDEQAMRFLMEKRFQRAKYCLQEASEKLRQIECEVAMASKISSSSSSSTNNNLPDNSHNAPLAMASVAQMLQQKKQLGRNDTSYNHLEPVTDAEYMMGIFSKHTLPPKEKKTMRVTCRKLRKTLITHYSILLVYLGEYADAEAHLNLLPESHLQGRVIKARLYLNYMRNLKLAKRELDYLWKNHKEVDSVITLREQFRSTIKDRKARGTELILSKQYKDAIHIFGETIEAFPADFHLYFKRAQCLRRLKLYPAAVKDLFECINLCGGSNAEAEHALGDSLYELGLTVMNGDTSTTMHDTKATSNRNMPLWGNTKRIAAQASNQTEKTLRDAIAYFSEALKWNRHYKYLLARGDCYAQLKEHENALKNYMEAKELHPTSPSVLKKIASLHNEWSKILFNERKFEMAEEELTRSLEIFRENSTVYLNRAKVRFRLNKHADAVQDVVAAFLLDRENYEAVQLVKQYVPTILADPEYQERFKQKLFSMKERAQQSQEDSGINANKRLSRRHATVAEEVEAMTSLSDDTGMFDATSEGVLEQITAASGPSAVSPSKKSDIKNALSKIHHVPSSASLPKVDTQDSPTKNENKKQSVFTRLHSASSSRFSQASKQSRESTPRRPTTAPSAAARTQRTPKTKTPISPASSARSQSLYKTARRSSSKKRPASSSVTHRRPSNRERNSLSRQLQYSASPKNSSLRRPMTAGAVGKRKQRATSTANRRQSLQQRTFAEYAHERFRERKQKKEAPGGASPGVKHTERFSTTLMKTSSLVVAKDNYFGEEALKDGHVHRFT